MHLQAEFLSIRLAGEEGQFDDHRSVIMRMSSEALADDDVEAQFLAQLTSQGRDLGFIGLDLAAREFPPTTHLLTRCSAAGEHASLWVDDHAADHLDRWLLHQPGRDVEKDLLLSLDCQDLARRQVDEQGGQGSASDFESSGLDAVQGVVIGLVADETATILTDDDLV